MYGSSGFAENFNLANMMDVQTCANSTGNYVHYMDVLFGFAEKFSIENYVNSTANCVH